MTRNARDRDPVASAEGAGGAEGPEATAPDDASAASGDLPAGDDAGLANEEPSIEQQFAERTADLQRLQAEYVNYRKRVERDRALARTAGEASVLRSLLTVLDDIGRAEKHGELEGGFKAVADALHQAVKAHRLESFGAPGEAFDPKLHEALFHSGESSEVEVTTIDSVVRTGYRIGDDVIRHAQVGVVDPAPDASAEGTGGAEGPEADTSPPQAGGTPTEGQPPADLDESASDRDQ